MSIGTYLVGAAVLLIVTVYITTPFRRIKIDFDRTIEKWVSAARNQIANGDTSPTAVDTSSGYEDTQDINREVDLYGPVNFCPQCGRRVEVDHRFCPGCGVQLKKEQENESA
jgi:hypothetical protein